MQDTAFEDILFKAAEKVKNIPASFVTLTAIDLHESVLMKGFSFSSETEEIEKLDSDFDADLEVELEEEEEEAESGFSLFNSAALFIGNIARHIVFPSIFSSLKMTAKVMLFQRLSFLRFFTVSFLRIAIATTMSFIAHCLTAFRAAMQAAFAILKWVIRLPYVSQVLLALGAAGAAFAAGKYLLLSEEDREKYKQKAKSYIQNLVKSDYTYTGEHEDQQAANLAYLASLQNLPPEVREEYFKANPHLKEASEKAAKEYKETSRENDLSSIAYRILNEDEQIDPKKLYYIPNAKRALRLQSTLSDNAINAILSSNAVPVLSTPKEFTAESEILETMVKEGWSALDNSSPWNYSRFGINFNRNRSKAFIDRLTPRQAYDIYKKEYWDAAGVDNVPEELKRVYFNTAVNMGPGTAKKILAASDGTLEGFSTVKWNTYNSIVHSNPAQGKYLKGWRARMIKEYNETLDIIEARVQDMLKKQTGSSSQIQQAPVNKQKGYLKHNKQIIAYDL